MSAQHSAGIQTLLDAEREASKIVEQARQYRTKKVKAARDEAKKEIEQHRKNMETKFREYEAEHTRGNEAAEQEALKSAEAEIQELEAAGKKKQAAMADQIVSALLDVEVVPPTAEVA